MVGGWPLHRAVINGVVSSGILGEAWAPILQLVVGVRVAPVALLAATSEQSCADLV